MFTSLPNLIIAGVAKGGTTSLFHYLAQQREICPSDVKELDYFAPLRLPGGTLPPVEAYATHFEHCSGERFRMEASPSYCYAGRPVIGAIREILGEPRILISLRDPVTRFWSAYTFLQSMGRLPKSVSCHEFIDQCLEERGHTPLSVGRYVEWLPTWLEEFEEDLHLVFAEQLFTSPRAVVENVLNWLDIDGASAVGGAPHNTTAQPRSHLVAKWAYRSKRWTDQNLARVPRARSALRNVYRSINTRHLDRVMPDSVRDRLGEHYANPTRELSQILAQIGITRPPEWLLRQV